MINPMIKFTIKPKDTCSFVNSKNEYFVLAVNEDCVLICDDNKELKWLKHEDVYVLAIEPISW